MVSPIHVSMHIGDGNRNGSRLDMEDSTSATGYYKNLKNSTLFHVCLSKALLSGYKFLRYYRLLPDSIFVVWSNAFGPVKTLDLPWKTWVLISD